MTSSSKYGPMLQLIRQLAGTRSGRKWARSAARSGVWRVVALEKISWPSNLPAVPIGATAGPKWWTSFTRNFRMFPLTTATSRPHSRFPELLRTLADGHAWLTQQNLAWLAPWFRPLWADTPLSLVVPTQAGLVGALAVIHLGLWGPADLEQQLSELSKIPCGNTGATPGDCVAIHVLLENLIAELPVRLKIKPPQKTSRKPGGLRLPRSLCILAVLRESSPIWWQAVEMLARWSPLTQLVYADIFDGLQSDPGRFAALFRRSRAGTVEDFAGGGKGAMELWASHLARSLLAACYSPPPWEERRLQAWANLQKAEAAARRTFRWFLGLTKDVRLNQRVIEASSYLQSVTERCSNQYWDRLDLLAAATQSSLFFNLRFLDMLVRRITADCGESMVQAWKRDHKHQYDEPRSFFFFGEKTVCRQRMETVLFGMPGAAPPEARRARSADSWRALRPKSLEFSEIRNEAAFSQAAAERVLGQYEGHPVQLPFQDALGYPPYRIWSDWFEGVANRIAPVIEEVRPSE